MREKGYSIQVSTAGHGDGGKFRAYGDISRACDRFFAKRGMSTGSVGNYKQAQDKRRQEERED